MLKHLIPEITSVSRRRYKNEILLSIIIRTVRRKCSLAVGPILSQSVILPLLNQTPTVALSQSRQKLSVLRLNGVWLRQLRRVVANKILPTSKLGSDLRAIHLRDRVRVRVESNNRWMAPWKLAIDGPIPGSCLWLTRYFHP